MINLSKRELQVLNLIAFEHTSGEIAAQLYISENTAKSHRKNLLKKLAVKNIAGMVRRGFELGILELSNVAKASIIAIVILSSHQISFGQGNAQQVQDLCSVDYDDCTATATIRFPMNENYSICGQTNQLREIDIYGVLPDNTEYLLGRIHAQYQNVCPSAPAAQGYCRWYYLCNGTTNATLSKEDNPGVRRTGVLTVPDMPNEFFGKATKIRFVGIYDQECCNEAFGFTFDKPITGPTQAAIAASPTVSSLSSDDCNRVTVNWNGIAVPGGCGASANWSVQVFRDNVIIGATKNSSFLDPKTDLVPGQTYAYRLVSVWVPNAYRVNQNVASNPVNITIPQPPGRITGKVVSQSDFGVQGVTVTATLNNLGSLGCSPTPNVTTVKSDVTDQNGNYEIQNLFVGVDNHPTAADYTVVASLGGHDITPMDTTVLLTAADPTESAVDFTDNSVATVTGTVFDHVGCPLPGALVYSSSNGTVTPVTSGADGTYALQLPGIGSYSLRSTYLGEDITRQMTFTNLSTPNFNFSHTLKDTICGFIGAGCQEYIGQATIQAKFGSCNNVITATTNDTGYYEMIVPRRNMTMKVTSLTLVPNSGLIQADVFAGISYDSTLNVNGKTKYDIIYRRPLVLEVDGLPPPSCSAIPVPILETGSPYYLDILVWDKLNSCPSDTGTITINNFISGTSSQNQLDTSYNFSNGFTRYFFKAGEPMLTGDHRKSITISAQVGNRTVMETIEVVVVGGRKRGASFITAPVELPLMILRDPPGDESYSFFEAENSFSFAQSFDYNTEEQVNIWAEAKLGADVFGFKIWGSIEGSLDVKAEQNSSTENVVTITITSAFSTSSNQNIIGAVGDVYVGAAINFEYSLADILEFDLQNCQLNLDTALYFNPQGFSTDYLYTEGHIKSNVLPDLRLNLQEAIVQNQTDSVVNRIRSAISVWQQAIDLNAELKEEALNSTIDSLKVRNYSFDAAVEDVTKSVTTSRTETRTINFATTIDAGVAAELGFEAPGGSGLKGGVKFNFRTTIGESTTNSINTTNTIGYVYNDDDLGDFVSFDVGIDPVFGTPVFGNVLGETSCPNEEPTARRDDMEFSVVGSPVRVVPQGQDKAFFDLQIGNIGQGQPGESRYYKVFANTNNVPSGITIRSGTSSFPVTVLIEYGDFVTVPVEISLSNGSPNYTLEGHEFFVIPECEEDILDWYSKSVYLSAYFSSPCSDLTMPTPTDNWLVTNTNNNLLNVIVDDYNLATSINEIVLEYGDADDASWTQSDLVIPGGNLSASPNGTSVNWNVSDLPDGAYKIRWRLKCNGTTFNYSQRRLGIIDRSPPIAYGKPKPTDDNYVFGDEISVKLDQIVNCNALSSGDIVMRSFPGNTPIPFQYTCSGEEIIITPSIDISANIGTSYIIEIYNLEDENGNVNPDSVTWNFVVNDMDSDGDGIADSFDRCPGGNDFFDTDLGGTPDDCDCDPLSATYDGLEDNDCDQIENSLDVCPDSTDTALNFNGFDNYVQVNSNPAFNVAQGDFTFTAWINKSNLSSPMTIMSKGAGPGGTFVWNIDNHKIGLTVYQGGATEWRYSTVDVSSNTWNHVAVVFDHSESSVSFYLNGVLDVTQTYTGIGSDYGDITVVNIGRNGWLCNCEFFQGSMDELSIWNKTLTAQEILEVMTNTASVTTVGLIAAYGFNDGKACLNNPDKTTLSESKNTFPGTLKNFGLVEGCNSNWTSGSNKIENCTLCADMMEITAAMGVLDGTYEAGTEIKVMPGALFAPGRNVTLSAPNVLMEMDIDVPGTTLLTVNQDGCQE